MRYIATNTSCYDLTDNARIQRWLTQTETDIQFNEVAFDISFIIIIIIVTVCDYSTDNAFANPIVPFFLSMKLHLPQNDCTIVFGRFEWKMTIFSLIFRNKTKWKEMI